MSKEKAIDFIKRAQGQLSKGFISYRFVKMALNNINNVSKMIGSKRIKLSEGMAIHIQNVLVLALKELED